MLNATGEYIQKAIFVLDGHNMLVDNFEFTGAATPPGGGSNGAGIKVEDGSNDAPAGGNITVTNSYFHDNQDGYLSNNSGPGIGSWFVPNSYTMLKYDDFYRNGAGDGESHNIYIGYDNYLQTTFTLQYSKSRDSFIGHLVKTRAPTITSSTTRSAIVLEPQATVWTSAWAEPLTLPGTCFIRPRRRILMPITTS